MMVMIQLSQSNWDFFSLSSRWTNEWRNKQIEANRKMPVLALDCAIIVYWNWRENIVKRKKKDV